MNSTKTAVRDLGDAGIAFVKSQLATGDVLARLLIEEVSIESGEVIVHLPLAVSIRELDLMHALDSRQIAGTNLNAPIRHLAIEFLGKSSDRLLLFENNPLRIGYPVRTRAPLHYFVIKPSAQSIYTAHPSRGGQPVEAKAVLSVLSRDALGEAAVDLAFLEARRYPAVGTLTSSQTPLSSEIVEETDSNRIRELSRRTEYILIGAYDETTFVIWRRRKW